MKQIFFTWIYAGQQYVFLIFAQWFLSITYHHARTPIFLKKYKSVFLIYPSDREVACLYNSRREAQCSHGLMFIDFSFPLSVYKRPPVNRTSLWPVHSGTLNAVQRRSGTHGPLWYFYTTLHIFPRLSQRQCYHCANSSTNVLSTWKWLALIAACFSFVLFLHSPTLIWH